MFHTLFPISLAIGFTMLVTGPAEAAEAALFNDGNRAIITAPGWTGELLDVDLRGGVATRFDPQSVGAPVGFKPGGCSKSGFVLGTTGSLLLACDVVQRKCVTVYTAPRMVELEDLAYNPKDGAVLLTCTDNRGRSAGAAGESGGTDDLGPRIVLIYVPADASKAGSVFCRRVSSVDGIAFAGDGTLYFSSRGDMWVGSIEEENDVPEAPKWVLDGERVAPVAMLETNIGTSASTGASEVAVSGKQLYVHTQRIGGSGMGDLFRMDRPMLPVSPDYKKADPPPAILDYAKRLCGTMSSIRYVKDYARPPWLTTSANGRFTMYGFIAEGDESQIDFQVVDSSNGSVRKVAVKRSGR